MLAVVMNGNPKKVGDVRRARDSVEAIVILEAAVVDETGRGASNSELRTMSLPP